MPVFVLDTNFFIQAHRANYPFDVFPGFWNKVVELAEAGKIISIDKVKDEICGYEDALKVWCNSKLSKDFWKSSDYSITEYAKLANWAVEQNGIRYTQSAIDEFLDIDEADAFVISHALTDPANIIIVTQEVSSGVKKKIKIPDVCDIFDVQYVNTIEMFRRLNEKF